MAAYSVGVLKQTAWCRMSCFYGSHTSLFKLSNRLVPKSTWRRANSALILHHSDLLLTLYTHAQTNTHTPCTNVSRQCKRCVKCSFQPGMFVVLLLCNRCWGVTLPAFVSYQCPVTLVGKMMPLYGKKCTYTTLTIFLICRIKIVLSEWFFHCHYVAY